MGGDGNRITGYIEPTGFGDWPALYLYYHQRAQEWKERERESFTVYSPYEQDRGSKSRPNGMSRRTRILNLKVLHSGIVLNGSIKTPE
jgi:hypothetical protein